MNEPPSLSVHLLPVLSPLVFFPPLTVLSEGSKLIIQARVTGSLPETIIHAVRLVRCRLSPMVPDEKRLQANMPHAGNVVLW